jgi:hypothetical protein
VKPLVAAGTAGAASLALVAGLWLAVSGSDGGPSADAASLPTGPVVNTSLGLPTPTGDPELPGIRGLAPASGTVGRLAGPFDDRFVTRGVTFDGRALHGSLTVTSDVSEILALQVLAGFYDADGRFVGQARWDFRPPEEGHEEGHPDESVDFVVEVPAKLRGRAAAASYGVTNLVNE